MADKKASAVPNLVELARNDEGLQQLAASLQELLAGAARGLTTDTLGAPVDIVGSALGALGVPGQDAPVGGSKWLREAFGQPTEDSGTAMAGNLASAALSPAKASLDAAQLLPMLGGIFMGPKSKTWDVSAAEYLELMEQRMPDIDKTTLSQIFEGLNVFRSPGDKLLRQEIPDEPAALRKIAQEGQYRLGDIFDHPELFKAYPELRKVVVDAQKLDPSMRDASFARGSLFTDPVISFNADSMTGKADLLHEIQHAVQQKEGFARGGSSQAMMKTPEFARLKATYEDLQKRKPGTILPKSDDDLAYMLYKRLAGEAEARLVETRAGFPADVLRQYYPGESDGGLFAYDIDPSMLIDKR